MDQILSFILGIVVAFLSTNVGGGGLLVIPSLIFLGLPPQVAVATMRFSGTGGMISGFIGFARAGKARYRLGLLISAFAIIGTVIGALTLSRIDPTLLCHLIAIGNLVILALVLFRRLGLEPRSPGPLRFLTLPLFSLAGLIGTLVGGTSVYITFLMVTCFGQTYSEAAATRKIAGLLSALVAIFLFHQANLLDFHLGIPLFLGTTIGGHFGAAFGLRRGDRWLGRAFTVMVLIASARLLFR